MHSIALSNNGQFSFQFGYEDTLTDTERRTGDRCTEERSDLGIEIWYHVPASAEKVSYNVQFFI